ncbi:MAG TPA: hypothetical protein ENI20_13255 [Bacteroides sp.]|nr:hypothetical protein [Bacteroides sp.]
MKTVILIPYFGSWPPWMDYFLESCRFNPHFSWILISDAGEPKNCPPNVQYKACSLDEFNQLASSKLKLDININNPYKLCDLKPGYGFIFSELISDYDFWGHSDLDLIYGNLNHFLGENILSNYDIISSRKNYFAGHFGLFRNTDLHNQLFKNSSDYRRIFGDSYRYYGFDERSNYYGRRIPINPNRNHKQNLSSPSGLWINRIKNKLKIGLPDFPADMSGIISEFSKQYPDRTYMKDMVKSDLWFQKNGMRDWKVTWEKGRLYSDNNEYLHFHFLQSKRNSNFIIKPFETTESFSISPEGIG